MLSCPLCRTEWCITSKLCDKCNKVKHLMDIYSRDKVVEILEKVLVVEQFKETFNKSLHKIDKTKVEKEEEKKQICSDDLKDYDNPEKIPESEEKEYLTRRKADLIRKKKNMKI